MHLLTDNSVKYTVQLFTQQAHEVVLPYISKQVMVPL